MDRGSSAMRTPTLSGVSEMLMWNLYQRAWEARRRRPVLHDPKATELVDMLDYPFEAHFGRPIGLVAQGHALRVLTFDIAVREFLTAHPDGTVVQLAEGLETQFWRCDNGRAQWLGVELPETAELRRSLLPDGDRRRTLACSALDLSWCDEVDSSRGVLITAQGLLMYLHPGQVSELIARCAEAFPGSSLVFDTVPRWFSARTLTGTMRTRRGFPVPPMPWGVNRSELPHLHTAHPAITSVRQIRPPAGRGLYHGKAAPLLAHLGIRNALVLVTAEAQFAHSSQKTAGICTPPLSELAHVGAGEFHHA
ncbi:class I SAM-dependent methyltransferase [Streptomyces sp. CT34]|uniref:class I SAM-dependent methyltransferase n=1 Tax=Streptomyces sp. CT34 TaxID=1553907 RepID=UPI0007C7E4FD|nr:class I SAM-dependent methyltransferase [Streptomyces sp. CT34]